MYLCREVTAKKFFSAATSLSERTETSPGYIFWTVPTTILALMGVVYFISETSCNNYLSLRVVCTTVS